MKRLFLVLALILGVSIAYSQKKRTKKTTSKPPTVSVSFSVNPKEGELIEKLKVKGFFFDVYQKNNSNLMSEQTASDTLIEYYFTPKNSNYSLLNIQKYATIKGKIAREGFYKTKADTLITTVNYYDPYHGGALISYYVPDKNGWLKEVKYKMKAIDTDTVSDRYIKTEKMNVPYSGKN